MKVMVRLPKGRKFFCEVEETNQLDAAAAAVIKGKFYAYMPHFNFKDEK